MTTFENCIIKIPGNRNISLPDHNLAFMSALDKALEDDTYQVIFSGKYDRKNTPIPDDEDFAMYVLFEMHSFNEDTTLADKIKEQVSYACSPEIIESSNNYQLIEIDYCNFSFK